MCIRDRVQVIAGDSKGQTGKVLKVEVSKQRAIVEGILSVQKMQRGSTNTVGSLKKRGRYIRSESTSRWAIQFVSKNILIVEEVIQWQNFVHRMHQKIADGVAFCTECGAKAMQQKRAAVISYSEQQRAAANHFP